MAKPATLYIPSYVSLGNHPKTRKLAVRLGVSKVQAVGHLHFLWWWAMTYAPDGRLDKYTAEDIAIAAEWDWSDRNGYVTVTSPEEFVTSLIECGFITDNGLHDWPEYGGKVIENRKANAEKQARFRENQSSNRCVTGTSPSRNPLREDKSREEKISTPTRGSVSVDAARPPKPRRKNRLSADWKPSETNTAYAKEQGFSDAEIARQAELFRDHWLANGETKDDWDATWRNWIRRAPEFDRARSKVVPINGRSRDDKPDFAQMARDMESNRIGDRDPWN